MRTDTGALRANTYMANGSQFQDTWRPIVGGEAPGATGPAAGALCGPNCTWNFMPSASRPAPSSGCAPSCAGLVCSAASPCLFDVEKCATAGFCSVSSWLLT